MIIPLFAVLVSLRLTNTYLALISPMLPRAPGVHLPVAHLLRHDPRELEEAARIDGCSDFGPSGAWSCPSRTRIGSRCHSPVRERLNELVLALVAIRNPALRTIPLGLQIFVADQVEWARVRFLSMATLPVIVVYVLMQRTSSGG